MAAGGRKSKRKRGGFWRLEDREEGTACGKGRRGDRPAKLGRRKKGGKKGGKGEGVATKGTKRKKGVR